MSSTFDRSGLRLICGEADKTSKFTSGCSTLEDLADNLKQ